MIKTIENLEHLEHTKNELWNKEKTENRKHCQTLKKTKKQQQKN